MPAGLGNSARFKPCVAACSQAGFCGAEDLAAALDVVAEAVEDAGADAAEGADVVGAFARGDAPAVVASAVGELFPDSAEGLAWPQPANKPPPSTIKLHKAQRVANCDAVIFESNQG